MDADVINLTTIFNMLKMLTFYFKEKEIYYSCAWSTDPMTREPLLVVGGFKGVIRPIVPFKSVYKNLLIGHGSSINDLRFHPHNWSLLLSASKDFTLRLWNVNTSVCIAIFGGAEGHRDEVLSGVIKILI
jgi:polycomb protein EED